MTVVSSSKLSENAVVLSLMAVDYSMRTWFL